MSGALVLWREGTVRPAHSSAAVADPSSDLVQRLRSRAGRLARAAGITRRGVGFSSVQQEHLDLVVADLRASLAHVEDQLAALSPAPPAPITSTS